MNDTSLLALDVGNSTISAGLFEAGEMCAVNSWPMSILPKDLWLAVNTWFREEARCSRNVAIASVVSGRAEALAVASPQEYRCRIVTADIDLPLTIHYEGTPGIDRLLAAVAALERAQPPFIVVHVGTAVVIDLVLPPRVFEGGIILAAAGLRARALALRTSALPLVMPPDTTVPLIGHSTVECIASGLDSGLKAEIEGLISRIRDLHDGVEEVLFCGGGAESIIGEETRQGWTSAPHLVLEGLAMVAERST